MQSVQLQTTMSNVSLPADVNHMCITFVSSESVSAQIVLVTAVNILTGKCDILAGSSTASKTSSAGLHEALGLLGCLHWIINGVLLNYDWIFTELILKYYWAITELILKFYWIYKYIYIYITEVLLNCYWVITEVLLNHYYSVVTCLWHTSCSMGCSTYKRTKNGNHKLVKNTNWWFRIWDWRFQDWGLGIKDRELGKYKYGQNNPQFKITN